MIKFILFGRCVAFLKLKSKPIWILTLSLSAQAQICGSNFPTVPITNRREWVRFHINLGSIYTDDWWKRPSGQIYDHMALFIGLSQVMLASRSKPMQRVSHCFVLKMLNWWFGCCCSGACCVWLKGSSGKFMNASQKSCRMCWYDF